MQFNETEVAKLKAIASERGHAVARVIRELIEDGYRYRRGAGAPLSDEKRAQLRELAKPGNGRPPTPEGLRPVTEFGAYER